MQLYEKLSGIETTSRPIRPYVSNSEFKPFLGNRSLSVSFRDMVPMMETNPLMPAISRLLGETIKQLVDSLIKTAE